MSETAGEIKVEGAKVKTQVDDIDRNIYDVKNADSYDYKMKKGLDREIVLEISEMKGDPDWMRDIRLHALEVYGKTPLPTWGPDLSELKMDDISTYVKPKAKQSADWDDVPSEIKETFERLGIPQAERSYLAGVGAQYDSEVVYHNMKEELLSAGVIYTDMETAVREYPEIVKSHFMKCVPVTDHKFAALHAAVWSGGSFVYVPKDVKVDIPIQSYFRLNSPESGQFEHTLIIVEDGASLHFIEGCSAPKYNKVNLHAGCVELFVGKNAYLRYSTIENWSKNMMNLNTKKAIVDEGGEMEWVTGSFGSKVSMLYPMSILNGEGSKTEYTGITFAGAGQTLDTGVKVLMNAPNTSAVINSKSISKGGGSCTYRSMTKLTSRAHGAKCSVSCESLMLDDKSRSDTIPTCETDVDDITFSHEAKIGKISDRKIFYLMLRGLSEEDAKAMIVRGFAYPISKELPMEYAAEMNNLINLELEGGIG
ncbi:MAG: Fe-S cluster assembly protein SufB [Firmicutes bacterium]|nr:Fe-S cluster assembly protein SufB [Bacillota bacterium]